MAGAKKYLAIVRAQKQIIIALKTYAAILVEIFIVVTV